MVRTRLYRAALAAAACAAGIAAEDARASLPPYLLVGSYALPAGGGALDVLPDGRLIAVQGNGNLLMQTGVNSSAYQPLGSVGSAIFDGAFGNFGASFLSVNPDGSRLAIGDNGAFGRVHFVQVSSLDPESIAPTTFVQAPSFDGAWANGSTIYVSGFGSGAGLWRVDATGLAAAEVVHNSVGGAGGVAIRDGRVFVGDGFNTTDGGGPTGNVRAFELEALAGAGSSVAFDTGTLVADALSASPVRFDGLGNMLVGGGDFFAGSNDFGYGAVIDADAIGAALLGGPLAPDAAELRLSPAGGLAYYGIEFNAITEEVLLFADGIAYRYAAVPGPGSAAMVIVGGVVTAGRRRRR